MRLTEGKFLNDVAKHSMTIIRDDGVYRHIRFRQPGSSNRLFDLITWPGYLCYTGDMGTYVFRRLNDMFEFFRTDRDYAHRQGKRLGINLGYWAEKLEGVDRHNGVLEFNEDLFNHAVKSDLMAWIVDHIRDTTREERRELWDTVIDQVVNAESSTSGAYKQVAVNEFSHRVNDTVGRFYFQDFWENKVEDYTRRYQWCCYAIAWGVQLYDEVKAGTANV